MEDKYLMEKVLYARKVINDLYMHGVIESANEKIMDVFNKSLSEALKMHNELFLAMKEAEIYSVSNIDDSKIKQTKKKLENNCENILKKDN